MEVGEIIYLSLHCHHQNDSCIKMGSDESLFNVSVGSVGQSHRTVSTTHTRFEEKREPKRVSNRGPSAYQPNALPLGQTGSHGMGVYLWVFDSLGMGVYLRVFHTFWMGVYLRVFDSIGMGLH